MDAVLTYKHELGMNYNFIRPDLIVGSCLQVIIISKVNYMVLLNDRLILFFFLLILQTPDDVDKLRGIGVKTIFCLQQDSDLEYPK